MCVCVCVEGEKVRWIILGMCDGYCVRACVCVCVCVCVKERGGL